MLIGRKATNNSPYNAIFPSNNFFRIRYDMTNDRDQNTGETSFMPNAAAFVPKNIPNIA